MCLPTSVYCGETPRSHSQIILVSSVLKTEVGSVFPKPACVPQLAITLRRRHLQEEKTGLKKSPDFCNGNQCGPGPTRGKGVGKYSVLPFTVVKFSGQPSHALLPCLCSLVWLSGKGLAPGLEERKPGECGVGEGHVQSHHQDTALPRKMGTSPESLPDSELRSDK